jgi:hemoglobin-like flavoprotein
MNRTTKQRKSSKAASQSTEHVAEPFDPASLLRALDAYAAHEARITERFYEIFFERRPDTLELFGAHSIAEREEMMRETLRALLALCEGESWLEENLAALGRSHWEYGVTTDMYDCLVDALIDCSREMLGERLDEEAESSLRLALCEIARLMSSAGESAARDYAARHNAAHPLQEPGG